MTRFLLDANLSGTNARYLLERHGVAAVAVESLGLKHLPDPDVLALARAEGRVLITRDRGIGQQYRDDFAGELGVVIMLAGDRTGEEINGYLDRFFLDPVAASPVLDRSLVIVDSNKIRVRTFDDEVAGQGGTARRRAGVRYGELEAMNDGYTVRVFRRDDPDYDPDELLDYLDELDKPDEEELALLARINVDPQVVFGKPRIDGTRIWVGFVLGLLRQGLSREEIAENYHLTIEDVQAALYYAETVVAEKQQPPEWFKRPRRRSAGT